MSFLSSPMLLALFIAFRLMALALYRPGGLIVVAAPYPGLPSLFDDPLLQQWAWGVLLLPFDAGSLWLLLRLLQRVEDDEESGWRATLWAVSPLPLWAWLSSATAAITFLLLLVSWSMRLRRRGWMGIGLLLALFTIYAGPSIELTAPLLAFVLLSAPFPGPTSALFTLGALLAGPVVELLGVTGVARTVFSSGYLLALAPMLIEWVLMVQPMLSWHRWRARVTAVLGTTSVACLVSALFFFAPAELRPSRLAASPLAPLLVETQHTQDGWFLTTDHGLWEEAVALGRGMARTRVLSLHNTEALKVALQDEPAEVWFVEPAAPEPYQIEASQSLAPLLATFYQAEERTLANGARARRYATAFDAPLLPLAARFADGTVLEAARVPEAARSGALLPVELNWEKVVPADQLFLHFLSPEGTIVSQRDAPASGLVDRHALQLPGTLQAGRYTLVMGRYDPATGERVALSQGGDTIVLSEVEVGTQ